MTLSIKTKAVYMQNIFVCLLVWDRDTFVCWQRHFMSIVGWRLTQSVKMFAEYQRGVWWFTEKKACCTQSEQTVRGKKWRGNTSLSLLKTYKFVRYLPYLQNKNQVGFFGCFFWGGRGGRDGHSVVRPRLLWVVQWHPLVLLCVSAKFSKETRI